MVDVTTLTDMEVTLQTNMKVIALADYYGFTKSFVQTNRGFLGWSSDRTMLTGYVDM